MKFDIKSSLSRFKFFNRYSSKIKRAPWILARDAFIFIIMLVLLDLIFVEILFYQYAFTVKFKEPEATAVPIRFHETIFDSILKKMDERNTLFENPPKHEYEDPFLTAPEIQIPVSGTATPW